MAYDPTSKRHPLTWWQWLLIGAGCSLLAILAGPVANRFGIFSFVGLVASLLACAASAACWAIAAFRFVKWVWSNISNTAESK
jgi:hypothetical protein